MWLGKEKPRDERGFDRPVAFQASANATGLSTRLFGKKRGPPFCETPSTSDKSVRVVDPIRGIFFRISPRQRTRVFAS
jgi:hypothetical protein